MTPLLPPLLSSAVAATPWWAAWEADWSAMAALLGIGMLYLRGEAQRRRQHARPAPGRLAAFGAGWLVTLLALVSPVAGLSGELLWVHMIQHLLLIVVAAPLLALGAPQAAIRRAVGPGARRALSRGVRRVSLRRTSWAPPTIVLAAATHAASFWVWHAPGLYDLAVDNAAVHLLEHAFFLGSGVWFWMAVVAATRRGRRQHGLATLCLGGLIAQGGVLGALLTFTSQSVYDVYEGARGLTALEDQQLAGAIMWVPPGFVYATVGIALFIRWMGLVEREARQREAREREARHGEAREREARHGEAAQPEAPPALDEARGPRDPARARAAREREARLR
jgi:putative membrane protein